MVLIPAFFLVCLVVTAVAIRPSNDVSFWKFLVEDVTKGGGYIHPAIQIVSSPHSGITMFSTDNIPNRATVAIIPSTLTITMEDINRTFPSWSNLYILSEISHTTAPYALYLAHISVTDQNNTHFYGKYVPDTCINGCSISKDFVKMMDDRGKEYLVQQQGLILWQWEEIQLALKNGIIDSDEVLSNLPFSTFLWATCLTYSRRFTHNQSYILMLGDFINHGSEFNILWYFKNSNWVWVTTKEIKKGEEVITNYGRARENLEFLNMYGFVVHDNLDEVGYILRKRGEDPMKDKVMDLLEPKYEYYAEFTRSGFTEKDIISFRISFLPEFSSYYVSKILAGVIILPVEEKVWDYLLQICHEELKNIPGISVEEDLHGLEKVLEEQKKSKSKLGRSYWAGKYAILGYRVERRKFIEKACEDIKEQLGKVRETINRVP